MIVEYNLEANGTIPNYIADGGYFLKANDKASPQDWDMIGIAASDGTYIPETLTVLNKAALITRLTNLGCKTFNYDIGEYVDATAEEIEAYVDNFINTHDT
tara:strand:+ start:1033 stop:1335 length:303 start_codon:yes stop_codon:yes gene_type:complete